MGKYTSTKGKVCRRFGVNLFGNAKYDRLLSRRPNPPGFHGAKGVRKKVSEYGRQLIEKQKLKITYGLREKQFRLLFQKAANRPGITGENFLNLLEERFDNVIYRLGWAPTRSAARQCINHGHFRVNGRRMNIASYNVKVGDDISIKDSNRSKALLQRNINLLPGYTVPEWLNVSNDELKAQIVRLPMPEDIAEISDVQMVVELYSK